MLVLEMSHSLGLSRFRKMGLLAGKGEFSVSCFRLTSDLSGTRGSLKFCHVLVVK